MRELLLYNSERHAQFLNYLTLVKNKQDERTRGEGKRKSVNLSTQSVNWYLNVYSSYVDNIVNNNSCVVFDISSEVYCILPPMFPL